MRQLVFRSANVYCQKLNNLKMQTRVIFIHKWKEGETGKQQERQRKRVCESVSFAERQMLASVIKLAVGKTH
jgi:hypothetical protein